MGIFIFSFRLSTIRHHLSAIRALRVHPLIDDLEVFPHRGSATLHELPAEPANFPPEPESESDRQALQEADHRACQNILAPLHRAFESFGLGFLMVRHAFS